MWIMNPIQPFLELPYKKKILAPDDADPHDNGNRMECQFHLDSNTNVKKMFQNEFGLDILKKRYFLNCVFIFDTSLIHTEKVHRMREWMYKYPIMACNEMGVMNLFFHNHWEPFPFRSRSGDHYLFAWSESCWGIQGSKPPKAKEFCLLKYPNCPS